jgi:hypothetical protein
MSRWRTTPPRRKGKFDRDVTGVPSRMECASPVLREPRRLSRRSQFAHSGSAAAPSLTVAVRLTLPFVAEVAGSGEMGVRSLQMRHHADVEPDRSRTPNEPQRAQRFGRSCRRRLERLVGGGGQL